MSRNRMALEKKREIASSNQEDDIASKNGRKNSKKANIEQMQNIRVTKRAKPLHPRRGANAKSSCHQKG